MKIFLDNLRKIVEHNRKYETNEVSYKLGMNKYGDMVSSEKQVIYIWKRAIFHETFIFLIVAS